MKDAYTIIKRPLITEKTIGASALGKYVFEVDINANKIEIAEAIQTIFPKADVVKVNTLRVKGKSRRMGRWTGKTPDWKKAYVTLKPGQRLEIFEGA
jgi:large subunit ribosomal protein L23